MLRLSELAKTATLVTNLITAAVLSVMSPNTTAITNQDSDPVMVDRYYVAPVISYVETPETVVEKVDPRIPSDKSMRCPQYEQAIRQHGLYPVQVFSYIAWRESKCNPQAINAIWQDGKIVWTLNKNGSFDSGLLQVNSSWKTVTKDICGGGLELLRTLDCNLKVSKYLFNNGGLRHWSL